MLSPSEKHRMTGLRLPQLQVLVGTEGPEKSRAPVIEARHLTFTVPAFGMSHKPGNHSAFIETKGKKIKNFKSYSYLYYTGFNNTLYLVVRYNSQHITSG